MGLTVGNLVDELRIERLSHVLSQVPAEAIDALEISDPQFKAVAEIVKRHGEATLAIVVANALVSYRLRVRGEEYWCMYARFWSSYPTPGSCKELLKAISKFLKTSSSPLIEQKVKRVSRACKLLDKMLENPLNYTDISKLYTELSRIISRGGYQKTVAFAAKIAYYCFKALDQHIEGLSLIPMPIDKRVALLTSSSGLLKAKPDDILSRYPALAERVWRRVADNIGIEPMRLDTLLWLPANGVEHYLRSGLLASARDYYARRLYVLSLGRITPRLARMVAEEVLYLNPYTLR